MIARFKEEMGVMNPGCWCKGHSLEGRAIYDMFDIDPEQNEVSAVIASELTIDGFAGVYFKL